MFGLTKKFLQKQSENKNITPGTVPNSAPNNDFNIENAIVHTMQDDLKNLKNPNAPHSITSGKIEVPKTTRIEEPASLTKQSNSPFLNLANKNPLNNIIITEEKPRPLAKPEPEFDLKIESSQPEKELPSLLKREVPASPPRNELPVSPFGIEKRSPVIAQPRTTSYNQSQQTIKALPPRHHNWRLIFFSTVSFLLLLILGWIGFNLYKDKNYNPLKQLIPSKTTKETKPITQQPNDLPQPKPNLTYSEVSPNYLRIEDPSLDIKLVLKQYAHTVSLEGYIAPIEFVVTDANNKTIDFKSFANRLGLSFSPALMALLGESFTLFIYNDTSAPKIGLVINSRDDINLSKVLLQEEPTLADELSPLFFTTDYKKDKPFFDNEYKSIKIRFQNIISPENLSVDYAVHKNNLLIGTTKLSMYAIIDHFLAKPETTIK